MQKHRFHYFRILGSMKYTVTRNFVVFGFDWRVEGLESKCTLHSDAFLGCWQSKNFLPSHTRWSRKELLIFPRYLPLDLNSVFLICGNCFPPSNYTLKWVGDYSVDFHNPKNNCFKHKNNLKNRAIYQSIMVDNKEAWAFSLYKGLYNSRTQKNYSQN